MLFEQGGPVAVQTGGEVRFLEEIAEKSQWEIRNLLIRKQRPGCYVELSRTTQYELGAPWSARNLKGKIFLYTPCLVEGKATGAKSVQMEHQPLSEQGRLSTIEAEASAKFAIFVVRSNKFVNPFFR